MIALIMVLMLKDGSSLASILPTLVFVSMLIFGGPTLHYFAVALTIGILFGIYSSVFVAAAIAMWLGLRREDLIKPTSKELDPDDPNAGAVA